MRPRPSRSVFELVPEDKGCSLRDRRYIPPVATLSWMDAAELLFQMKDEIRRSPIGRDCLDRVAARRRSSA